MQTQKDHVDAYAFLMGRMTSALVTGDANGAAPARRGWVGLMSGLVLALLIAAGCLVFGLIAPAHSESMKCDPGHLNPSRVLIRGGDCPAADSGLRGEPQ